MLGSVISEKKCENVGKLQGHLMILGGSTRRWDRGSARPNENEGDWRKVVKKFKKP